MRITSVALVLTGAVAAGGVAIAAAGSGSAAAPITKAQALAFAQAVNLRPSDLPGSEVFHQPEMGLIEGLTREEQRPKAPSPAEAFPCAQVGKAGHHPVANATSTLTGSTPNSPYGFVQSRVVVMPNERLAAAELATLDTRRGRACLVRLGGESVGVEGEKKTTSFARKVAFIPVAKLLGPRAIALHILAELPPAHEKGETEPKATFFYLAAAWFRVGPAEIGFLAFDSTQQLPAAIEAHLLSLLHSRAEAHKL